MASPAVAKIRRTRTRWTPRKVRIFEYDCDAYPAFACAFVLYSQESAFFGYVLHCARTIYYVIWYYTRRSDIRTQVQEQNVSGS